MKNRAFKFEKRSVSRTYLLVDADSFENGNIIIVAYFTVALKTLFFNDTVPKRKIQDIDGFSKDAKSTSAVIIGQLGKSETVGDALKGADILDAVLSVIAQVKELVGGRIAFLECQRTDGLVDFYKRNGFLRIKENETNGLLQMVKFL